MKTLCIMFNVAPIKDKKLSTIKETVWSYWDPAKEKLLKADLLKRLKTYDKDNVNPNVINQLKPLIAETVYSDENLKSVSIAAQGLARWVRAIVQYDEAMKVVKPK